MLSDPPEPKPDAANDHTGAEPPSKPVDEKAQEDAGKVREDSGGYD
jgi:hypothetical protein